MCTAFQAKWMSKSINFLRWISFKDNLPFTKLVYDRFHSHALTTSVTFLYDSGACNYIKPVSSQNIHNTKLDKDNSSQTAYYKWLWKCIPSTAVILGCALVPAKWIIIHTTILTTVCLAKCFLQVQTDMRKAVQKYTAACGIH